jgi:predicted peptidase
MKSGRLLFLLGFLLFITAGCNPKQYSGKAPAGQTPQRFEKEIVRKLSANYLLFLPDSYYTDQEKLWPMILFLHGSGERGNDLELVKIHGPAMIVEKRKDFPFIVISPQLPAEEDGWSPDLLNELVSDVVKKYRVDQERMYLTGLSMGGRGTWSFAIEYPGLFAAIAPVCGPLTDRRLNRLIDTPVWVFHGAKDRTVPIKASEDAVAGLRKLGADVKFTVYPDAGHDSWTETYNNPELYEWFLQHKRKKTGQK